MMSENAYPALCLNADFRLLGFPVARSTLSWQDAVTNVIRERLLVIAEYDHVLRCPGSARRPPFEMRMPAVVAKLQYVQQNRPAAFTRGGVFLRDDNRCAYCSAKFASEDLTFDHVVPQSRAGRTNWINVVAACQLCNGRKANKLLKDCGMALRRQPWIPTNAQLTDIGMKKLTYHRDMPEQWLPFIGLEGANTPNTTASGFTDMDEWAKKEGSEFSYWHVPLEE